MRLNPTVGSPAAKKRIAGFGPREELLHPGNGELEVDGPVTRVNRIPPMWNVTVGAIQIAGAGHEKADAVLSIVAHL